MRNDFDILKSNERNVIEKAKSSQWRNLNKRWDTDREEEQHFRCAVDDEEKIDQRSKNL